MKGHNNCCTSEHFILGNATDFPLPLYTLPMSTQFYNAHPELLVRGVQAIGSCKLLGVKSHKESSIFCKMLCRLQILHRLFIANVIFDFSYNHSNNAVVVCCL